MSEKKLNNSQSGNKSTEIRFNDAKGVMPGKSIKLSDDDVTEIVSRRPASAPHDISSADETPNAGVQCGCGCPFDALKQRFVGWLKQRQTWGFLLSVAIMAVIAIVFFMPENFNGQRLSQHDMIQGIANGQEITAFEEATGEKSYWTDSLFGGMPTFQISPAYPSDSLFRWFNRVYGLFLPAPSNLLFMMMLGFMILMTALRYRWEYGLLGAIAWGFSSYFIIIIGAGHIWKFVTLAYIPPTVAGVIIAYRGRYLAGGAMAAFFAMMQLMSNHIQMTYYFGFLIVLLAVAFAVEAYRNRELGRWLKASLTLIVAAVLAVCANLPNIYHTWKYSKETQRAGSELVADADQADASSEQSRDYITHYSYRKGETFTLLIPNYNGGATLKLKEGNTAVASLAEIDDADQYTDPVVHQYLAQSPQYFGEMDQPTNGPVYVGALIFVLFIIGCVVVRGPVKWALLSATLLSILLAWGKNFMGFTDMFLDLVPMYNKFRTPESILVVAEFTMPMLAVMGLYEIVTNREALARRFKPVAITFSVVGLFCLLVAAKPSIAGSTIEGDLDIVDQYNAQAAAEGYLQAPEYQEYIQNVTILNPDIQDAVVSLREGLVRDDALRSFLFILLGFGVLAFYCKGKIDSRVAVGGVALLVLFDLYFVDKRYLNSESFDPNLTDEVATIEPTDADRIILADNDLNYRVVDLDNFNGARSSYFHKTVGGYHAAKLSRIDDLLKSGELSNNPNVLEMLNTKWAIYKGQALPTDEAFGLQPLGNAWYVDKITYVDTPQDEFDALQTIDVHSEAVADKAFAEQLGNTAFSNHGTITETSYAPNRLTYETNSDADGIVVFSEVYFPWGWEATIDGKPAEIARANYILRAMRVPAGHHVIEMKFEPASIGVTVTIAYIAVILIYLAIFAAIFRPLRCRCKAAK